MPGRTKSKNKPILKYLVIAGGLLFLGVIITQGLMIKDLYSRTDQLESEKIKSLIIDPVQNLGNEPVKDINSSKDYIPVARLAFPSSDDMRVKYSGDKELLEFSDRNNLAQAISNVRSAESYDETFEHVPNLQACSRQVALKFDQGNVDGLELVYAKTLTDGRTAYLYKSNFCSGDSSRLVNYLKQVDSY